MSTKITTEIMPVTARKSNAKFDLRMFVVAPLLLMGIGSVVPFGGNAPLIAALSGQVNAATKVTIIARADGTFDIKEFPQENQWFAPEVIGEGLQITVAERYGAKVAPSSVNVLVTADPGASDASVKAALASARSKGFARFGFVDPRVGKVVTDFAATPTAVVAAQ